MKLDTFNRTVTFKGWITKETDNAYLFSIKKGKKIISYWLSKLYRLLMNLLDEKGIWRRV